MNIIQLNIPFTGDTSTIDMFMVHSDQTSWPDIIALFDDMPEIPIALTNGYVDVAGIATKSADSSSIIIKLDEPVTIPRGACIEFLVPDDSDDDSSNCDPLQETDHISDALKLAVVDADGCVTEYVTLEALREYLLKDLITDACDLFDSEETQPLVAGDEFVAVNGCNLKRIKQSDLKCQEQ